LLSIRPLWRSADGFLEAKLSDLTKDAKQAVDDFETIENEFFRLAKQYEDNSQKALTSRIYSDVGQGKLTMRRAIRDRGGTFDNTTFPSKLLTMAKNLKRPVGSQSIYWQQCKMSQATAEIVSA